MTMIGSTSHYASGHYDSGLQHTAAARKNAAAAQSAKEPAAASKPVAAFQAQLLSAGNLKPVDMSALPDDRYETLMAGEERRLQANMRHLEHLYTDTSWTETVEAARQALGGAQNPATQPYASVVVDGQVVAKIDNQGVVTSDDDLGEKLKNILPGEVNGTNGPDLAEARARQIADMLGGRIEKADTAISQGEFAALASDAPAGPPVDYEAMKQDPLYTQLQNMMARLNDMREQRAGLLA